MNMVELTGILRQHVMSLLQNVNFIRYALDADERQTAYWDHFSGQCEQAKIAVERARYILQHLDSTTGTFTEDEIEELRERIKNSLKS